MLLFNGIFTSPCIYHSGMHPCLLYLFIYFKGIPLFLLFIYFWLCWVFVSVQGLSLVAASGGHSFINLFIYLFIYFWLYWVFVSVRGLSQVAASGGHSSSRCAASLVAEHRLQTRRLSNCGSWA